MILPSVKSGRPGENRGEAGTYGAENHRPPDDIPDSPGVNEVKYGMTI